MKQDDWIMSLGDKVGSERREASSGPGTKVVQHLEIACYCPSSIHRNQKEQAQRWENMVSGKPRRRESSMVLSFRVLTPKKLSYFPLFYFEVGGDIFL